MTPADIALRGALIVLRNGGTTTAAARVFGKLLAALGERPSPAVWRLDFVAISVAGAQVAFELVGPVSSHLSRVSEAMLLADRAARGEVAAAELAPRLSEIERLASPYPRWLGVVAAAIAGGAFARFAGGDLGGQLLAAGGAALGQTLRAPVAKLGMSATATTFACAATSACVGSIGLRLGWSTTTSATLVASVIELVPGLPLINGFLELRSREHLIVGLQRIVDALAVFLALALALALAYAVFN